MANQGSAAIVFDEIDQRVSKRLFKLEQGSPKPNKYQYELSYAKTNEGQPEAEFQVSPKYGKKFGIANAGIPHTMNIKELQNSLMKSTFNGRLSPKFADETRTSPLGRSIFASPDTLKKQTAPSGGIN